MRQLCIIGHERSGADIVSGTEGSFDLEGVQLRYGIIETEDTGFDAEAESNADMVFFRVHAFSCNYRDRAFALSMTEPMHRKGYYVIGSDFVGEVLATGRNVTGLAVGDRVIGDGAFPDSGVPGLPPGIPTNHGSRELQVLHHRKLIRIPETMSDAVAAGFAIGAQTSYSMIRRLQLQEGDNVLVTGAKSNTALFALAALRNHPVHVYGLSTSDRHAENLAAMGLRDLIVVDPSTPGWSRSPQLDKLVHDLGGFDAMIDPFSDVYLAEMPILLAVGGRHITCGVADQHSSLVGRDTFIAPVNGTRLMANLLVKNISIIGNCLGQTSDLQAALEDSAAGRLTVPVYSQLRPNQTGDFFADTYLNKERFGKVTLHYD